MAERKAVTREVAFRYRQASKNQKRLILDELCALTGWHRDHARRALREVAARPVGGSRRRLKAPVRRRRAPVYDEEFMRIVRVAWAVLDGPCGKRLAPVLPELVRVLAKHREVLVSPEQRELLGKISAATIDRRLAPDRKRLELKGRSGTKPGGLLKHQIPIRTFADWDDDRPGFVEVDLVGHEGGNPRGDFCQTLTVTDIATGWTENQAVRNKAQRWVFEAFTDIRPRMPFPLLGLDSDNGAEFINHELMAYCAEQLITFTRGRSGNKNDNCYVEQKNWAVVRRAVGYRRYDTVEELKALNALYAQQRLMTNFFIPQAKLIDKQRDGARVRRRYDTPHTPYQRALDHPAVSAISKLAMGATYRELNPAHIRREIARLQKRLINLNNGKIIKAQKEVRARRAPGQSR
jgi:hypothetical protein